MLTDLPGAACLANFCVQDESEQQFLDELRHILEVIARTGNYWHEWCMVKCLLSFRLKQVLTQYNESHIASGGGQILVSGETFSDLQRRLLEGLDLFVDGPPFTLQRLCELLLNPQLIYPNIDKVALAFEKLLLVTSTLPLCKEPYPSFAEPKGQHGGDQTSELQHESIGLGENGALGGTMVDEEMTDAILAEDKETDADKLPVDEASLTSKNKLLSLSSEENHFSLADQGKVHVHSESPLMDDDYVDIPLEEQGSVTEP